MKKLSLIVSILTLFILSFIGCANSTGGSTELDNIAPVKTVEISLDIPDGTQSIWIDRRNVTNGIPSDNSGFFEYAICSQQKFNKVQKFTDPFVTPNNTYQYIVRYYGNKYQESPIITKKVTEGLGELQTVANPKATYDATNGIMTFTTMPSLIESQKSFADSINAKINSYISYKPDNGNGENWAGSFISDNMDFKTVIRNDNLLGQKLYLNMLNIAVNFDDNFEFRKYFKMSELTGIPQEIIIPDSRFAITCESNANTNGVKINIPTKEIPANSTIYIGRTNNYKTNGSGDMPYWYIFTDDLTKTSITDYFVTKGESYTFKLYFRDKQNKIIKESKSCTITAESGVGYGLSTDSTIEVKDNKYSKITPVPSFPEGFITTNLNDRIFSIGLVPKEGGFVSARITDDGSIISMVDNKQVPISSQFIFFESQITKDKVFYHNFIYPDELNAKYPNFLKNIK